MRPLDEFAVHVRTESTSISLPWATRTFLVNFDRIVRSLFRIEESGLPAEIPQPCLIVANHRRDADIPILGVFLGRRQGRAITGVLPHFVAREDLFEPGFLWNYWRSPWLVGPRLVAPLIPLERIMKVFKAHPIHRIPEQSLGIVLNDLRRWLGDRRVDQVLHPRWTERLRAMGADPEVPISRLLRRESAFEPLLGGGWGHRRLNRSTFRVFKQVERARIAAHLHVFSRELQRQEAVMVAPEGANSPNGFFQRPRVGPYWLARTAPPSLQVLPVGLAYDPSASIGMRVFVHAGPTFSAGCYSRRVDFDAALAASILRATTVTGTHLSAHYVLKAKRGERLSADGLRALAEELDPLFREAGARVAPDIVSNPERRLRWFARAGLLKREGGCWRRDGSTEPEPGWGNRASLAAFLRNELASVVSLAPTAPERYGFAPVPYRPLSSALSQATSHASGHEVSKS